jgi:twitching motility protein PilT
MISLINEINKTESKHIITVEDPIEFIFENKKSLIEQREVENSTLTFSN